MDLSALLPAIDQAVGLDRLRRRMSGARDEPLTLGIGDGAKAAAVAALVHDATEPVVVITPKPQHAEALAEELRAWLGPDAARVRVFPERDALPYERLAPDSEDVAARLAALASIHEPDSRVIVVACAAAVAQRTISSDDLARSGIAIRRGGRIREASLMAALDAAGYRMEAQIATPGEASRRGGIIDIWPPSEDQPLRIELFGDEVESLRTFDPSTQRSSGPRDSLLLVPAREIIHDPGRTRALAEQLTVDGLRGDERERYEEERRALLEGERFEDDSFYTPFLAESTLLHHLPSSAILVVDEPADIAALQKEHDAHALQTRHDLEQRCELPQGLPLPHTSWDDLRAAIVVRRPLNLARWAVGDEEAPDAGAALRLAFGPVSAYGGRLRVLAGDVAQILRGGQQVVIVSTQDRRLSELLEEHDVYAKLADTVSDVRLGHGALTIVHGSLAHGWSVGEAGAGLTLLTDAEVFGFSKQRRAPPRKGASREAFLADLEPDQYVVHIEHGIAKFAGLVRRGVDGGEREYLELHYSDGDRLYVPVEQVDRVARYVGPSEHRPSLTRLGSQEWPRAKARVRRAVQELATELLALYASREVAQGHAFPVDGAWETELAASFPYVETTDQQLAIRDVKADMQAVRPMDRLVCGDVGYGKTEVAVRAAFKSVVDGAQVAVLVPTTVLAQQHYTTFKQRLAGFPVRVEMLSRFRSDKEQRQVAADLLAGNVDIVVGTHRLLQKDIAFKNLGLVVIDEEQRFGVSHKERLKKMRAEVDVLTLTATPIPRTLNMALTGIRDMSTIETPPEERLPIKTYVTEFDDHLVREAIVREMERGGQVYFVHNRVHNIELTARKLRDIVPEAEILIGHGQMHEDQLEKVMLDFTEGKADVLVCTTIIESGLDIPNVNTIIINHADKFGLAQLYQLRGRVGRASARSYAYLLYEKHMALSEVAQKRLQTIFEATELGAGFQIALRDLEIRGAGNLLGGEQSGQIGTVGFDLYVKLLADAVEGLKALARGEPPPPPKLQPPIVIDLPITAYIPESYIGDLNVRLALYQRMANILGDGASDPADAATVDPAGDLEQELADRFGPPPPPVRSLIDVVRLRAKAALAGVQSVAREEGVGGRALIALRSSGGDFRERLKPSDRLKLERTNAVTIGREQMRIDLDVVGEGWRALVDQALDMLAKAPAANT
jgi:transcription-repair coupling factor (superfamily II helicase)